MSLSSQNSNLSPAYCTTLQDSVKFLFKSFLYRLKIRVPKMYHEVRLAEVRSNWIEYFLLQFLLCFVYKAMNFPSMSSLCLIFYRWKTIFQSRNKDTGTTLYSSLRSGEESNFFLSQQVFISQLSFVFKRYYKIVCQTA